MLQASVRPVPKEHLAVIHPMQYGLERTYHVLREGAAPHARRAAEAARHSAGLLQPLERDFTNPSVAMQLAPGTFDQVWSPASEKQERR